MQPMPAYNGLPNAEPKCECGCTLSTGAKVISVFTVVGYLTLAGCIAGVGAGVHGTQFSSISTLTFIIAILCGLPAIASGLILCVRKPWACYVFIGGDVFGLLVTLTWSIIIMFETGTNSWPSLAGDAIFIFYICFSWFSWTIWAYAKFLQMERDGMGVGRIIFQEPPPPPPPPNDQPAQPAPSYHSQSYPRQPPSNNNQA